MACVIVRLISDSPGHKPDQSRAGLEEELGAVCVQSEGHADPPQLPGGILDGNPQKSHPAGRALRHFKPASSPLTLKHFTLKGAICVAGRRDLFSAGRSAGG